LLAFPELPFETTADGLFRCHHHHLRYSLRIALPALLRF
jgi:hypothetical protein